MKKRSITGFITSLLFCSTTYAVLPGFYIGLQPGYSMLHYNNSILNATSSNITNNGFGGRVYGGYQFSPVWGTELGFEQFATAKFNRVTANGVSNISGSSNINAIDLVLKGTYPLGNSGFDAFAKAGGAYEMTSISNIISTHGGPNSANQFLFTYGFGFDYDICPELVTDLTWMRIQNSGGTTTTNADLLTLGLGYYFG